MVPPFLAYYGVITRNRTIVAEAYNQLKLYRQYLRDPRQGMWRHVVLGTGGQPNDPGFWSTGVKISLETLGIAWKNLNKNFLGKGMAGQRQACCGFTPLSNTLNTQTRSSMNYKTLNTGLKRFMPACIPTSCVSFHFLLLPLFLRHSQQDTSGLFTNYIDISTASPGNFHDAASTAFLASTVYRAAKLFNQKTYIPHAERSRKALSASAASPPSSPSPSNSTTNVVLFPAQAHFTTDGILTPVVDPFAVGVRATTVSAEAQAFVVQMHVAWKDWKSPKLSVAKADGAISVGRGKVLMLVAALSGTVWMAI